MTFNPCNSISIILKLKIVFISISQHAVFCGCRFGFDQYGFGLSKYEKGFGKKGRVRFIKPIKDKTAKF